MKWMRGALAVLIGYVLAQGLNSLLVLYWYINGHAPEGWPAPALTAVLFLVFGAVSGYLAGAVAGVRQGLVGGTLAALIALVTVGNIMADVAAEPLSHKLLAMVVLAPAAWLGATAHARTRRAPRSDSAAS